MTPNPIVAVVERDGWYTMIRSDGKRSSCTLRSNVDWYAARDGLWVRWDLPLPTIDGCTAWPIETLAQAEGVAS